MKFNWITYTAEYNTLINAWLDNEARDFTSIEESWDEYVNYWIENSNSNKGEYFRCKVIADERLMPFGVIAIGLYDETFIISEFLIEPQKRNKGFGSSALKELLLYSVEIIGKRIERAEAVIYPTNAASQKMFEKAGFVYKSTHPDGDAMYYTYCKI